MEKLLAGLNDFHRNVYPEKRSIFRELATQQDPHVMFITCADSRVDPTLLLRGEPGDIFVSRNAGNIIPPYENDSSGVAASVEYAVRSLGIREIVVCGHSDCGAMKALLNPDGVRDYPAVARWIETARPAREAAIHSHATGQMLLRRATEENIKLQIAQLAKYPSVAAALAKGEMNLYGWYYDIGSGNVDSYDPSAAQFVPFNGSLPVAVPAGRLKHHLDTAA